MRVTMVGRQKIVDLTFFYLPFASISGNRRKSPEKNNSEKCITPVFRVENDGDVYFKSRTTRNRF